MGICVLVGRGRFLDDSRCCQDAKEAAVKAEMSKHQQKARLFQHSVPKYTFELMYDTAYGTECLPEELDA